MITLLHRVECKETIATEENDGRPAMHADAEGRMPDKLREAWMAETA